MWAEVAAFLSIKNREIPCKSSCRNWLRAMRAASISGVNMFAFRGHLGVSPLNDGNGSPFGGGSIIVPKLMPFSQAASEYTIFFVVAAY